MSSQSYLIVPRRLGEAFLGRLLVARHSGEAHALAVQPQAAVADLDRPDAEGLRSLVEDASRRPAASAPSCRGGARRSARGAAGEPRTTARLRPPSADRQRTPGPSPPPPRRRRRPDRERAGPLPSSPARVVTRADSPVGRRPDRLPPDERPLLRDEGHVAHDAAVVPPVVPDRAGPLQLHRPPGDRGEAGAVVDLDRHEAGRAEGLVTSTNQAVWPPSCSPDQRAVHEDPRPVEGRPEVQLEPPPRSGGGTAHPPPVPGEALVLGVAPDAPRVGHVHGLDRRRDGLRPALRGRPSPSASIRKLPGAVQVDPRAGPRGAGEKQGRGSTADEHSRARTGHLRFGSNPTGRPARRGPPAPSARRGSAGSRGRSPAAARPRCAGRPR